MDRLRPPSCYVKFDVTSKMRDQFGLSDFKRVSPSAAPLRVPKAYPHPIQHYPDSNALRAFLSLFSHTCLCLYSCWGKSLHACAVCRVSPFSTTVAITRQQLLMSNACNHVSHHDNGLTA